jgi:hypothetical protein
MEPRGCQNEARDLPKHPLANRAEKVRKKGASVIMIWEPILIKSREKHHPKIMQKSITKKHEF